jgi:hypothetical protein
MKHIVLLAAFVAFNVVAAPLEATRIGNMVAQCALPMGQQACRVDLDKKQYSNPTVLIAGPGRVDTASYLRFKNAGPQMCNFIRQVCTQDGESVDCLTARKLWKDVSPLVSAPGNNGSRTIN